MKKNKFLILAFLIAFLGFLLRIWHLADVPPSLHWDEPSWGYNAYSILKTGRDEYGNFMPLFFKAFGDYKAPIYMYLTVISVAVFGLTEFAVRFPAALFGAISIFVIYFFTRELLKDFRRKEVVAILASLILALSPWDYHYSHAAWEINILLLLLLLGIMFFLKFKEGGIYFLFLSEICFGLCLYVYNSAKLLIPLIVIALLFLAREKLKKISIRDYLIAFIIAVTIILPVFKATFLGGAGGRLKTMSLFSYPQSLEEETEIAKEAGVTPNSLEYPIFHGSFNYYLRGVLGRYLNHFSPKFLFFEGDWSNPRYRAPNIGVLNFLDAVFLPLGACFLITRKIKNKGLIWYLLLITPLPSALSRDIIQATRSFFMIIPFTIISALGMYFVLEKTVKMKSLLRVGFIGILAAGYIFSFIYYLDMFITHLPPQSSQFWQYGYKEAVNYVAEKRGDYSKVIFTQKYIQPYIYYLFYTKYDPSKYQAQAELTEDPSGDVGKIKRLDKIEFRNIYWPEDRYQKDYLFVGNPYELPEKDILPEESRLIGKIEFLNGETAFHIVETVK